MSVYIIYVSISLYFRDRNVSVTVTLDFALYSTVFFHFWEQNCMLGECWELSADLKWLLLSNSISWIPDFVNSSVLSIILKKWPFILSRRKKTTPQKETAFYLPWIFDVLLHIYLTQYAKEVLFSRITFLTNFLCSILEDRNLLLALAEGNVICCNFYLFSFGI